MAGTFGIRNLVDLYWSPTSYLSFLFATICLIRFNLNGLIGVRGGRSGERLQVAGGQDGRGASSGQRFCRFLTDFARKADQYQGGVAPVTTPATRFGGICMARLLGSLDCRTIAAQRQELGLLRVDPAKTSIGSCFVPRW
jgi:hypothetical protein